jgi:hypothetical protein
VALMRKESRGLVVDGLHDECREADVDRGGVSSAYIPSSSTICRFTSSSSCCSVCSRCFRTSSNLSSLEGVCGGDLLVRDLPRAGGDWPRAEMLLQTFICCRVCAVLTMSCERSRAGARKKWKVTRRNRREKSFYSRKRKLFSKLCSDLWKHVGN